MEKTNTRGPLYFSMILVTILVGVLFLSLNDQENSEPIKKPDFTSSSNPDDNKQYELTGSYLDETRGFEVSILKLNDEQAVLVSKVNGIIVNNCTLNNNQLVMEDSTIITFFEDILTILDNSANTLAGTYKKTGEYSLSAYQMDTFGNASFLGSQWNGIYELDTLTIKIYQLDSEKYVLNIFRNIEDITQNPLKRNVGLLSNRLYIKDDLGEITITKTSTGIYIISKPGNDETDYINITGSYIKQKDYSFNEILEDL